MPALAVRLRQHEAGEGRSEEEAEAGLSYAFDRLDPLDLRIKPIGNLLETFLAVIGGSRQLLGGEGAELGAHGGEVGEGIGDFFEGVDEVAHGIIGGTG